LELGDNACQASSSGRGTSIPIGPGTRFGQMQAKGYLEEDFEQTFRRYIPRTEMEALRAELAAAAEQNAAGTNNHTDDTPRGPNNADVNPNTTGGKEDETGDTPDSGAAAA